MKVIFILKRYKDIFITNNKDIVRTMGTSKYDVPVNDQTALYRCLAKKLILSNDEELTFW